MQSFGDPPSVLSKHERYEIGCNWKEIFMALKIFVPLLAFSFILTLLRLDFGRWFYDHFTKRIHSILIHHIDSLQGL